LGVWVFRLLGVYGVVKKMTPYGFLQIFPPRVRIFKKIKKIKKTRREGAQVLK